MYKQYESKPPDMIKERVDKDYSAILRSALTSIPKVNKTDVETLRSTFGVRRMTFRPSSLSHPLTRSQSFANISKATSDQLRNLPGFGQVKVKNIENAFKKPFRNDATTKLTDLRLPNPTQTTQIREPPGDKEKTKQPQVPPPRQPPRESSPPWDIERDLSPDEISRALDAGPPLKQAQPDKPRPFDIDLDP